MIQGSLAGFFPIIWVMGNDIEEGVITYGAIYWDHNNFMRKG